MKDVFPQNTASNEGPEPSKMKFGSPDQIKNCDY